MGAVQDSYITVAWLVLLVVLLVIEIITVGLCRTGGCIFYCDNFTACIYQTICNAFY